MGCGHFRAFRPGFSIWHTCHVVCNGHFTLKQLRLSALNEMHTNSCTGPRLIGVNQNQKINLAFAMCDLHFKVDAGNETGACCLSDSMKNVFCKLYQIYKYFKEKCLEKRR